ncbi:hypothetical protein niasHS_016818 [Heterodera schachtii]|uniref:B30.2/SPRY domain-containing protein n=1 Tax=Heterodera schachtii TaxID=97005 RepID=A0ABD2HNA2_HETSC
MQKNEHSVVGVGLWSEKADASYIYYSNGTIRGHKFGGESGFATFEQGDTIGIGKNLTSWEAIYTKNGRKIPTNHLYITEQELETSTFDQNIRKAQQVFNNDQLWKNYYQILVDPQQFFNVTK